MTSVFVFVAVTVCFLFFLMALGGWWELWCKGIVSDDDDDVVVAKYLDCLLRKKIESTFHFCVKKEQRMQSVLDWSEDEETRVCVLDLVPTLRNERLFARQDLLARWVFHHATSDHFFFPSLYRRRL